jgi:hypothetical protein
MAHSRGKSEADLRRLPHVPMRRRLLRTKGHSLRWGASRSVRGPSHLAPTPGPALDKGRRLPIELGVPEGIQAGDVKAVPRRVSRTS